METEKNCKICNRNDEEISKYFIADDTICNGCFICLLCAKKYYSKKEMNCNKCCNKCSRCKKIQLINNWPEDVIINGMCDKCFHLCTVCDKYILNGNAYYKSEKAKKRFCMDCFTEKFCPKQEKVKHICIAKKMDHGNVFMRWKKTHEFINCDHCDKNFWNYIGFKTKKCKNCKKTNEKKITNPDPSTENKKYIGIKKNNKIEWVLDTQKNKCFNCYSAIWIKKKNISKGNQYFCNKCNPGTNIINKKLKYNKDKQTWEPYRVLKMCKKCKKNKWFFTKNNLKICKSCSTKTSKKIKVAKKLIDTK